MRREEQDGAAAAAEPVPQAPLSGKTVDLPWIQVSGSYFATETGEPWTPIGQNDAISWPDFRGLFRRKDMASVEGHLRWLAAHGVSCLRLMLEYAQDRHRYFEQPIGTVPPNMIRLWDDLFALCERYGIRILLTPFDTFWTWRHWHRHPYNQANGGCLDKPSRILLCRETREAIKNRLTFAVTRWGGSGALFAWDLWNEIHPAQAEDSADTFGEFIQDLSQHVRGLETRLHGRAHPQTVSLFGPELWWKPNMPLKEPIFRHPDLDFASIHIYREGTIDDPQDTVAPAIDTGQIVRNALAEMPDRRPFFDSEHGPIHAFKDKHITLPEPFDDEYFRHMQWAHLASGAAGGGMRWPNRRWHVLTSGMRAAQRGLAGFTPLIDWPTFRRRNLNEEITVEDRRFSVCGCGDDRQAVVWLLRTDTISTAGTVRVGAAPCATRVTIPGLRPGAYALTGWKTATGQVASETQAYAAGDKLVFATPPIAADMAFAIRPG